MSAGSCFVVTRTSLRKLSYICYISSKVRTSSPYEVITRNLSCYIIQIQWISTDWWLRTDLDALELRTLVLVIPSSWSFTARPSSCKSLETSSSSCSQSSTETEGAMDDLSLCRVMSGNGYTRMLLSVVPTSTSLESNLLVTFPTICSEWKPNVFTIFPQCGVRIHTHEWINNQLNS